MALTLAPDTEARLRIVADRQGLSPDTALTSLMETILRAEEVVFQEDAQTQAQVAAALRQSTEDFAAGRWVSLEGYIAQSEMRRQARDRKP